MSSPTSSASRTSVSSGLSVWSTLCVVPCVRARACKRFALCSWPPRRPLQLWGSPARSRLAEHVMCVGLASDVGCQLHLFVRLWYLNLRFFPCFVLSMSDSRASRLWIGNIWYNKCSRNSRQPASPKPRPAFGSFLNPVHLAFHVSSRLCFLMSFMHEVQQPSASIAKPRPAFGSVLNLQHSSLACMSSLPKSASRTFVSSGMSV